MAHDGPGYVYECRQRPTRERRVWRGCLEEMASIVGWLSDAKPGAQ